MDLDLVFVIVVVVCSAAVDADVCFMCYVDEQQSLASSADVSQMATLCYCIAILVCVIAHALVLVLTHFMHSLTPSLTE